MFERSCLLKKKVALKIYFGTISYQFFVFIYLDGHERERANVIFISYIGLPRYSTPPTIYSDAGSLAGDKYITYSEHIYLCRIITLKFDLGTILYL